MKVSRIQYVWINILIKLLFFYSQSQFYAKAAILDSPLDWGTIQVNSLLNDRPQLQSIALKGNKVWNWLINGFGNTNEGIKIHWDPGSLSSYGPYDAESYWLDDNKNVYIRAGKFYRNGPSMGHERLPEEILFSIVFELNNVKYRDENLKIRNLAKKGEINRLNYIRSIVKCEYRASQETGVFYRDVWTPFCIESRFNLNPHTWIIARDVSFEQWLNQFPPDFFYPWQFYGKQYDIICQQAGIGLKPRETSVDGVAKPFSKAN